MSADTTDGRTPDIASSLDQALIFPTEEQIAGFLGRRFKKSFVPGEFIHTDKITEKRLFLSFPTARWEEFSLFIDGGIGVVIPSPASIALKEFDGTSPKQIIVRSESTDLTLRTSDLTAFIRVNEPMRLQRHLPHITIPIKEALRSIQAPAPAKPE